MKYSFIISFLILISCNSNQEIDEEKEKQLIIDLIESESNYFMSRDVDRWQSIYVNEPYIFTNWTLLYEPGDVVVTNGYNNLVKTVSNYWNNSESKGLQPFTNYNYNIQLRENVAWANFIQRSEGLGYVVDSYNTRILEKIDGEWKFAGVITATDFKDATPPIPCNY